MRFKCFSGQVADIAASIATWRTKPFINIKPLYVICEFTETGRKSVLVFKHMQAPFLKQILLKETALDKSRYPLCLPIFHEGFALRFTKPVTIISGDNGVGKSTILEALAHHVGFNISGGSRNHVYKQAPDVAQLSESLMFSWLPKVTNGFFMRAESFINFAGYIDELAKEHGQIALNPYGGKSLNEMSHGEAFLSLFENRFGKKGFYILDEPEAALSPMRQLQLIRIIHELDQSKNAQLIIVTHSPILMAYPNAQFLYVEDNKIRDDLRYTDTDHYKLTRRFLERPDLYLAEILAD